MPIEIESVEDVAARWTDIEPLLRGIHEYHLPLTGVPLLADWAERQRAHLTARADGILLLAVDAGHAVGLVNGWVSREPSIFEETYARLDNMFVVDTHRGAGVGAQLLAAFEARCIETGIDEVRLGVVTGNEPGERFWERAGFAPASVSMKKQLGHSPLR